ncbi:MAG: AraC family transcriptional regulator [Oscillatoriophycideae cyanobacterium NC_groundwater_1537_Pr4_S-0.65um_50_18]|nr:AraC family transcriptional regulator [Oscillatoriophycideae cyanobacterium NC_groundwater_1537_Pr4_S-0.65um_50_18]
MREKTVAIYMTRPVIQFVAQQGVDLETLYTAVGFNPELLKMPDTAISRSLHYAIWREAIRQTGDDNLALHLGEVFSLSHYGIVGYVLLNCQTLNEVFEKFCKYTCLFCQEMLTQLTISDGMAFFECNSIPGCKPDDDLLETARYDTECTFASSLSTIKALTGKVLRPVAVWFRHQLPADLSEYNRIFQCDVKFSMPVNRLIFDANCLEWLVLSNNANLLSFFEERAEVILDQLSGDDLCTAKVTLAIVQRLKGELPTVNAIASDLAMSTRQLQRALKVEGTSFQKLLDQTRQDLALQYLKDPTISIHSIAFLLGFSEPSAFNRAFKRWTGKTPGDYR